LAELTGHNAKFIRAERMSDTEILVTFLIVDTRGKEALKAILGRRSFATELTDKLQSNGVITFTVTGTTEHPGKFYVFRLG
jgi:hypothetical protein